MLTTNILNASWYHQCTKIINVYIRLCSPIAITMYIHIYIYNIYIHIYIWFIFYLNSLLSSFKAEISIHCMSVYGFVCVNYYLVHIAHRFQRFICFAFERMKCKQFQNCNKNSNTNNEKFCKIFVMSQQVNATETETETATTTTSTTTVISVTILAPKGQIFVNKVYK